MPEVFKAANDISCYRCYLCENSCYSKTCLKQNPKGLEHFSAEAEFPSN